MKRKITNIIIVLVAFASLALLIYPHLEHWLSTHNQSYVVQNYEKNMYSTDQKIIDEKFAQAEEYNQSLGNRTIVDPFAQGDMESSDVYRQLLTVDDSEIMGHIKIPKIRVDLPIYHGTSDTALQNGVGHMEGTSLPIGGPGTHSVLTGHTGLSHAKMFTDLTELDIGDEFYIYVLDRVLAYRIVRLDIILPSDTDLLTAEPSADYATLVTCTPYGVNSHRLLVRGERADYSPEEIAQRIDDTAAAISMETYLLIAGLALPVATSIILFIFFRIRRRKRKKQG